MKFNIRIAIESLCLELSKVVTLNMEEYTILLFGHSGTGKTTYRNKVCNSDTLQTTFTFKINFIEANFFGYTLAFF